MFNAVLVAGVCILVSVSWGQFRREDPKPAEEESVLSQFLSQEVSKLQDDVKDLRTQVLKLTTSLSQLQVGETSQENEIKGIKDELERPQCLHGREYFRNWPHVNKGTLNPLTRKETVVFSQPFKRDPVVSTG